MRQRYRHSRYDRLNHINRFEVKMPRVDESLLNTLLCFTTTDSLTWQRTQSHKKLFNLRHTTLWNKPTKAINIKPVIPWNFIEASLIASRERLHPFQNSAKQNSNCRKPPLPICYLENTLKATLSQIKFQRTGATSN